MKKKNALYTTVTISDFNDINYINQLINLPVGFELALLTPFAQQFDLTSYTKDLTSLKTEISQFKHHFDQLNISLSTVRIHQPSGYTYNWTGLGFDFLKEFFVYCHDLGFVHYIIHTPYGDQATDQDFELNNYREKLSLLAQDIQLEVEEISASCDKKTKCYNGTLFEKFMLGQKTHMLLDTYECGGINRTIKRLNDLKFKNFEITSIHLHKDKHKFLTSNEISLLLKSNFDSNLVNEGFVKKEYSFDEFIKTKSVNCVVPNSQRIEILKTYLEQIYGQQYE